MIFLARIGGKDQPTGYPENLNEINADEFMGGTVFGAAIAALYGILYIIIQAEDFAFSMGAGLIFVTLSMVMYVTRNIDWYEVSRDTFQKAESVTEG